MLVELQRLIGQRLAVHQWKMLALDIGDEKAMRAAGQHGHLQAGLAQGGEVFDQLQLLAGIGSGQYLHHRSLARTG